MTSENKAHWCELCQSALRTKLARIDSGHSVDLTAGATDYSAGHDSGNAATGLGASGHESESFASLKLWFWGVLALACF